MKKAQMIKQTVSIWKILTVILQLWNVNNIACYTDTKLHKF